MTALVGEASCAEGLLSLLISQAFDLPQGLAVFLERCYYRSWPTSLDMGSGDLNKETCKQQSKCCPHDNEEDVLIPVQYSNVILPASGNSA